MLVSLTILSALTAAVAHVPPHAASYDDKAAQRFVGSQHWYESGIYADSGFKQHYDGYFCLCECHPSEEGIFCSGGGVMPDGQTKVASFLGVFAKKPNGDWIGNLAAYENTKPFADTFDDLKEAGGPSSYTGVSQSLGDRTFIWRGYMGGVDCSFADKCSTLCGSKEAYTNWATQCSNKANSKFIRI